MRPAHAPATRRDPRRGTIDGAPRSRGALPARRAPYSVHRGLAAGCPQIGQTPRQRRKLGFIRVGPSLTSHREHRGRHVRQRVHRRRRAHRLSRARAEREGARAMVGAAEQARARRWCVRRQFYRNERKRKRFRRERLRRNDPARGATAREQASRGVSGSFGREVRVGDARQDEAGRPVEPARHHPVLPDNSPEQGGLVELGRGRRPRGTVSQVALDRAAARDARLEPDAATGGSPKAAPRPATIALLTPAVSSDNLPSSPSPRTRLHHHHPSPGVIDEVAPAAACAPPDDAASDRYVDIEAGVREIIARARRRRRRRRRGWMAAWADGRRRGESRGGSRTEGSRAAWAALGVLWLYAIARLVLGA